MKTPAFRIAARTLVFLWLGLAIPGYANGASPYGTTDATNYQPEIQELVRNVEADATLRALIETAFAEQDAESFWYGATLEDLYAFFDLWLHFLPTPDDARYYMDRFEDFANSPSGHAAVLNGLFRQWITSFMYARGRYLDSRESRAVLRHWFTEPDIDMEDFVIPLTGYASFNDFFTRKIKSEARPIASRWNTSVLTSPADCYLLPIADEVNADTPIDAKGDSLSLAELLNNDPLAERFLGGAAHLCMLDTVDYHRFHSPAAGTIASAAELAGLYYGMDGEWVDHFFQHRRGYFVIDTGDHGLIGMVPVGMFTISSIYFEHQAGDRVRKGSELGHFAYGGSAIILLFEPGGVVIEVPPMTHVKMGERIGTLSAPEVAD